MSNGPERTREQDATPRAKSPANPANEPLRINLGCGPNTVSGWINMDRSPILYLDRVPLLKRAMFRFGVLGDAHMVHWPDDIHVHDLRKRLPFEAREVDAIYSSHTLEHLYRNDAQRLLSECRRVLAPGRLLRIALPDAESFARDLLAHRSADAAMEYNRRLLVGPDKRPSTIQSLMVPFRGSFHRWQPTSALVRQMLLSAGFSEVHERSFQVGELPLLEEVETRPESFFLEAFAPS